ncbi:hypothetical protein PsAD46_02191 [Pseudovibrio sp. Ad46]|uniref:DUF1217 domain-containing protein n=1 Tax=unclassified Pseudovibrio TaxID=2627060 RepID=UPI0007AECC10|nr:MULTISPECIES: DUF1217 domain-containing protein [unclassified Pseudovibrio]KZK90570.1 hypothetical protein PsAD46_02191 [Pseudovibrio sp. Ad46]KZK92707.1 hypothetical protein PsAD5_03428 [Pseudovibrio sp. Ad5]
MDTHLRFSVLNRDLPAAKDRTAKDPEIAREIQYYEENFKNVETVDDLLNDYRLYNFMMKTMGLEDMAYAKGMVRKVLTEGTSDEKALANTLSDGRFKELAEAFPFNKDGTIEGTFDWSSKNEALDEKVVRYTNVPGEKVEDVDRLADYYLQKMQRNVGLTIQLLADPALYKVVTIAYDIPEEIINGPKEERVEWFDENLDLDELKKPAELKDAVEKFKDGLEAQRVESTKNIIEKYIQVNFEEDEGEQNEGVRLALNFQRTAKDITDAYEILGSPALYQVVRTVLGMPQEMVGTNIDNQAAVINEKFDVKKFKNPAEVDKFVKKFVILYDAQNGIGTAPSVQLFASNPGVGIPENVLTAVNALKFGG